MHLAASYDGNIGPLFQGQMQSCFAPNLLLLEHFSTISPSCLSAGVPARAAFNKQSSEFTAACISHPGL